MKFGCGGLSIVMGVVFIHFQVDIGAESVMYGLLSAIRPILECCYVVWHHGLTKTQVEQLEAVLRRAIRIIFEVTSHMPYHSAMACANISSLQARREDINKKFFTKILNNTDNPLFNLLPPPRDAAIVYSL